MSDILLVHGSCHGAWCWRDLIPALQARGHQVRAIDLPGSGDDTTPLHEVTLDTYADAVVDALGESTVLLGHSAGGFAVTAAAERVPERVAGLIYLCAYVPRTGKSLIDLRKAAKRQPLMHAIDKSPDGISFSAKPECAGDVFFNGCDESQIAYAVARLGPQPIAPQAVAMDVSGNSQDLPRAYIRCTQDRVIPPEHQVNLVADWPASDRYELETGHSPFLSAPDELADLTDRIMTGWAAPD